MARETRPCTTGGSSNRHLTPADARDGFGRGRNWIDPPGGGGVGVTPITTLPPSTPPGPMRCAYAAGCAALRVSFQATIAPPAPSPMALGWLCAPAAVLTGRPPGVHARSTEGGLRRMRTAYWSVAPF